MRVKGLLNSPLSHLPLAHALHAYLARLPAANFYIASHAALFPAPPAPAICLKSVHASILATMADHDAVDANWAHSHIGSGMRSARRRRRLTTEMGDGDGRHLRQDEVELGRFSVMPRSIRLIPLRHGRGGRGLSGVGLQRLQVPFLTPLVDQNSGPPVDQRPRDDNDVLKGLRGAKSTCRSCRRSTPPTLQKLGYQLRDSPRQVEIALRTQRFLQLPSSMGMRRHQNSFSFSLAYGLAADGSQWGNTCAPEPPILLPLVAKPDFSPQTSRLVPSMVLPPRLWAGASDAKGIRVAIWRCADLPAPRARGVDGRPGKRFRCARRVVSAPASPCPACCWADWSRRLDGTARSRRQQAQTQTQMQTWACAYRTRHGTERRLRKAGLHPANGGASRCAISDEVGSGGSLAWILVCGDALDARMRVHRFCAPCYASLLPPRIVGRAKGELARPYVSHRHSPPYDEEDGNEQSSVRSLTAKVTRALLCPFTRSSRA
ncbi:hypothetical protein BKA81DRAFT_396627 [Phyllosticta paracitricarpa]|uniref:Uncharacterized protein n=1 Tax=Phyllosticta citricarpa TaxID=55181 RepID=A0ABR1MHJ7_9PEZI